MARARSRERRSTTLGSCLSPSWTSSRPSKAASAERMRLAASDGSKKEGGEADMVMTGTRRA
eukprot:scaffold222991_cov35-Tisochrysis_lutea.AAC.1